MTLKIKTKQLAESMTVLDYLCTVNPANPMLHMFGPVSLPAAAGYKLSLAYDLAKPLARIYEEKRMDLVKQFAKKDADGKVIELPAQPGQPPQADIEDMAAFEAAIAPLADVEIELGATPVNIGEMGNVALPPIVFSQLRWLITA